MVFVSVYLFPTQLVKEADSRMILALSYPCPAAINLTCRDLISAATARGGERLTAIIVLMIDNRSSQRLIFAVPTNKGLFVVERPLDKANEILWTIQIPGVLAVSFPGLAFTVTTGAWRTQLRCLSTHSPIETVILIVPSGIHI